MKTSIKNVVVGGLLVIVLLAPAVPMQASTATTPVAANAALEAQLRALLAQLQQKLAALLAQKGMAVAPTTPTGAQSYDASGVTKVTYQEVYTDEREATYRYVVTLQSGNTVVVTHPKKAKESVQLAAFQKSGFQGDDVSAITDEARRLPGLPLPRVCELELDKDSYEVNEPITLSWETSEPYAAFNTYGSSNGKAYLDESWRESEGSVTFKIGTPGSHYINLNTYPWKERFASGACTVLFQVGDADDSDEEDRERPEDPALVSFTVTPNPTVKMGDVLSIRYAVEKTYGCSITAEEGANKTTVHKGSKLVNMSNVPLPTWATVGSSIDYVLRCDSYSNAYYKSQADALVESIAITVVN
jgi:hypothetical protein